MDWSHTTEKILDLTLEIIRLLTGQDCAVVKKISGEQNIPKNPSCLSEEWKQNQRSTIVSPMDILRPEQINKKILEVTNHVIELLTGEVPIRCQDVSVYFSMEEWEYLEGHRDLYKDVMMQDNQISKYVKLEKKKNRFNDIMLNLTLEIIYLLTREGHEVVTKISGEQRTLSSSPDASSKNTSEMPNKQQTRSTSLPHEPSSITLPATYCPIPERNDEKILEVTKKMMELLAGEVPIRCQDVSVYFSMEEWEYLEGHRDLYKDVMMENEPPLTSPDGSRKRNPPERCPRPLYSRDSTMKDLTIPHHNQDEELKNIKAQIKEEEEETLVSGAQQSIEEGEVIMKSEQEESSLHMNTNYGTGDNDIAQYSSEVKPVTRAMHRRSNRGDESRVLFNSEESSDRSHVDIPNINPEPQFEDGSSDTCSSEEPSPNKCPTVKCRRKKKFPCPKCDKCFNRRSHLRRHENQHTGQHPYSCSECEMSFRDNIGLVEHERVHTDERPFSCSECGQCFKRRSYLIIHHRVHTGESPFKCSECGKCYKEKGTLNRHQRTHTGQMPYTCAECGKSFARKGTLNKHERTHTGERPYLCPECGKWFKQRYCLAQHLKLHN